MSTIQDILHQCGDMVYATILDMIMSYYTMSVRKDIWRYLVVILPQGKYVYKKISTCQFPPSGLFALKLFDMREFTFLKAISRKEVHIQVVLPQMKILK